MKLREWRYARSKAESVPPYILLTNKQLAAIIQAKPRSLEALGKIDGVGPAKLEKYGKEILEVIAGMLTSDSNESEVKNE
jgi:DNA helicase-2/ATP-dependent DNA helicase PcrA